MIMYDFVYCFTINGKVNWSAETTTNLFQRATCDSDWQLIEEFTQTAEPGSFITLDSGDLIFCTRTHSISQSIK